MRYTREGTCSKDMPPRRIVFAAFQSPSTLSIKCISLSTPDNAPMPSVIYSLPALLDGRPCLITLKAFQPIQQSKRRRHGRMHVIAMAAVSKRPLSFASSLNSPAVPKIVMLMMAVAAGCSAPGEAGSYRGNIQKPVGACLQAASPIAPGYTYFSK